MSWLSDAWHGVENVVSDVGSFAASNASWLIPVGIGAAALATGGLALGAFGAAEAGGLAAGEAGALGAGEAGAFGGEAALGGAEAFGEGAAGIEAGIGGTAADVFGAEAIPGAVDISVTPWTGAALDLGATGAGEAGAAGTEAFAGGSLDALLGGGAGIEGGIGGLGTDVAALEASGEGGLSGVGGGDLLGVTAGGGVSDVPLAGELPAAGAEGPGATFAERFGGAAEAMPQGGTFSQAGETANTLAGEGTAMAYTPTGGAGGLPPEITTGGSAVGPTSGTAAGAAQPAGGFNLGGLGKGIEGALGSPWLRYGLPLAAIGATALRGPGQLPPQTRANQQATFGATEINQANAGQILPAQQAQIDQTALGARNKLYQLYASRGIDPNSSTDFQQELVQIQQQADAQKAAIIQNMITTGLQYETGASNILTAAANQQVALDNNFRTSLTSAISSFGVMAALGSGGGRNVNINVPQGTQITQG